MLKKLLIAVIVIATAAWLALNNVTVQDKLMTKVIEQRMSTDNHRIMNDNSLNAMVCGSASPFPSGNRAGPCIAIFAGGKFYVVDTGLRSWNSLALRRIPSAQIGGVFITHFHSDHIADLGEYNMQTWAAGRPAPLQVYGGEGIEDVVNGFELAYAHDRSYRTAHHSEEYLNSDIGRMNPQRIKLENGPQIIHTDGLLTVTAFKVDHAPIEPAIGYRFDYGDRSIVVSGDTVKSRSLIQASQNADLLFHEAQAQHMVKQLEATAKKLGNKQIEKIMFDIQDYHTSPIEAAEVANEAKVAELVMYHLTPPPPNRIAEKVFLRGVKDVRKKGTTLAYDGLFYQLPLGSKEIKRSRIKAPR